MMTTLEEADPAEPAVLLCGSGPSRSALAGQAPPTLDRDRIEAIGRIARDRAESRRARASAVRELAGQSGPQAERLLVEALEVEADQRQFGEAAAIDEPVVTEIVAALGRIGSEQSLAALTAIGAPMGERAREQWVFARKLIRFRTGASPDRGRDGEEGVEADPEWTGVGFSPVGQAEVAEVVSTLVGPSFGMPVQMADGLRFDCAGLEHVLLLNEAMVAGRYRQVVQARPLVAGLVVAREPHPGVDDRTTAWSTVRFVILTEPVDRGVAVTVHRTNGQPAASGLAAEDGEDGALAVRLRDNGRERSALEIDGTITNDAIDLRARVASRSRRKDPGRSVEV